MAEEEGRRGSGKEKTRNRCLACSMERIPIKFQTEPGTRDLLNDAADRVRAHEARNATGNGTATTTIGMLAFSGKQNSQVFRQVLHDRAKARRFLQTPLFPPDSASDLSGSAIPLFLLLRFQLFSCPCSLFSLFLFFFSPHRRHTRRLLLISCLRIRSRDTNSGWDAAAGAAASADGRSRHCVPLAARFSIFGY